jgi:hypothetical protein
MTMENRIPGPPTGSCRCDPGAGKYEINIANSGFLLSDVSVWIRLIVT